MEYTNQHPTVMHTLHDDTQQYTSRIQYDVVPGRTNWVSMSSDARGTIGGQCSEICGAFHGYMPLDPNGLYPWEALLATPAPDPVWARGRGGLLTHFWGVCIYDSWYG